MRTGSHHHTVLRDTACLLLLTATACQVGSSPPPTPDAFAPVAERANQAFDEGITLYQQGRYREALNAFERARTFSPRPDARIEQMIGQARAALTPAPTPGPPPPTPLPTTTPITPSRATPATEVGAAYFGRVFLTVVPGRRSIPAPVDEFFYEDQVGLYVDGLLERFRLPFTLRVFELASGDLVADVHSDGTLPPPAAGSVPSTTAAGTPSVSTPSVGPSLAAAIRPGTPAPGVAAPTQQRLVRFWDTFVWYHEGGEAPGRYRAELYADQVLTHTFDYTVGTVPIALPELPSPTPPAVAERAPEAPPSEPPLASTAVARPPSAPPDTEVAGVSAPPASAPAPQPARTTAPAPPPTPTPIPTPSEASTLIVGGGPVTLAVHVASNRAYVADAAGLIWTIDGTHPTLTRPFSVDGQPVDLAVDEWTGNLQVAVRSALGRAGVVVLSGATGQPVTTIPLPADPGDLQVDPALGLVYVVLPAREELVAIDLRTRQVAWTRPGVPDITGLALDLDTHTLYASQMSGQLSGLDDRTGELVAQLSLPGDGLAGVATASGWVYAISSSTSELLVVKAASSEVVNRFRLADGPAAVVAGEHSGTVYVLEPLSRAVVRIDPLRGADELGRVLLPQTQHALGRTGAVEGARPRMALNPANEAIYVSLPETNTLAVIAPGLFPAYETHIAEDS